MTGRAGDPEDDGMVTEQQIQRSYKDYYDPPAAEPIDPAKVPLFAFTGTGDKKIAGHKYYVYPASSAKTYKEAKRFCERQGGHLAIIDNAEENRFVYRVMRDMGYDHAYIGLSWTAEGKWEWADGDGLGYKNWKDGKEVKAEGAAKYAMLTYAKPLYVLPDGTMTEERPKEGPSYEFLPDENCAWSLGAFDSPEGEPFICEWGDKSDS